MLFSSFFLWHTNSWERNETKSKGVLTMKIVLQKVHGSGNEFFLIDQMQLDRSFTPLEIDQLRLRLCNRESGLLNGADGLLLVESASTGELTKPVLLLLGGVFVLVVVIGLRYSLKHEKDKEERTDEDE